MSKKYHGHTKENENNLKEDWNSSQDPRLHGKRAHDLFRRNKSNVTFPSCLQMHVRLRRQTTKSPLLFLEYFLCENPEKSLSKFVQGEKQLVVHCFPLIISEFLFCDARAGVTRADSYTCWHLVYWMTRRC